VIQPETAIQARTSACCRAYPQQLRIDAHVTSGLEPSRSKAWCAGGLPVQLSHSKLANSAHLQLKLPT
jgi:hypothetical protein